MEISDDLVEEILSRVGEKTLFRCKSICKNWRSLILDRGFLNRCITRLKTHPPLVNGFYYVRIEYKFTSVVDTYKGTDAKLKNFTSVADTCKGTDAELKFLECPDEIHLNDTSMDTILSFLPRKTSIVVVSSHRGHVLCVKNPGKPGYHSSYKFSYIICNPLTKQWGQLPKPRHSHYIDQTHLFCYNKKGPNDLETEFKVVLFVTDKNYTEYVEIFTSETGKWKSTRVPLFVNFKTSCSVVLNGSVYLKSRANLYAYDLKEETIRFIGAELEVDVGYELLGVSAGSIYYAVGDDERFRVWVLNDGIGWSLEHQLDYGNVYKQLPADSYGIIYRSKTEMYYGFQFRPLAFHPLNPNVIFVNVTSETGEYGRKLTILYHKDSGRVEEIGDLKHSNITTVTPYSLPAWVPSLNTKLI